MIKDRVRRFLRWPRMKRCSAWKFFVFLRWTTLVLELSQSKLVCYPKNGLDQKASLLDRADMEINIWVGLKVRLLDVNSSPFSAREVQPPLIYTLEVTADWTNTNRTNTSIYFRVHLSLSFVSCFLFFIVLQVGAQWIYEALGAIKPTRAAHSHHAP